MARSGKTLSVRTDAVHGNNRPDSALAREAAGVFLRKGKVGEAVDALAKGGLDISAQNLAWKAEDMRMVCEIADRAAARLGQNPASSPSMVSILTKARDAAGLLQFSYGLAGYLSGSGNHSLEKEQLKRVILRYDEMIRKTGQAGIAHFKALGDYHKVLIIGLRMSDDGEVFGAVREGLDHQRKSGNYHPGFLKIAGEVVERYRSSHLVAGRAELLGEIKSQLALMNTKRNGVELRHMNFELRSPTITSSSIRTPPNPSM